MRDLVVGHVKLPAYEEASDPFVARQVEATSREVPVRFYTYDYVPAAGAVPRHATSLAPIPYARVERAIDHRLWRGGLRRLARATFLRRLPAALARDGVGVVHAHSGGVGEEVAVALRGRVPFVCSFYGYDASVTLRENPRSYVNLFRDAHRIVVLSEDMGNDLARAGCPPEKLVVNHVWVDTDAHRPLPRTDDGPPRVFLTGRHVEKKGFEYALQALAAVQEEHDFRIDVTGTGPLTDRLKALAASLGLDAVTTWHGRLPTMEDVVALMARADVLLAPSVVAANGDKEGMPSVFIEAGAVGLPSIGTYHAGIPEIVEHGKTGLLAPERDAPALAEHLRTLLGDAAKRRAMGAAARARVEERFSRKSEIPKLVALYRAAEEAAAPRR